jgi:hypothetical protein
MDVFKLSRQWFDWCFENPEKISPNHTALYFFCIEHCNRLGWKERFGLPTTMAKEAIGIRSYNTYINTLNDLVAFGFVSLIEKSKNQYSSNIIALSKFDKTLDNALDKALIKHTTKQYESTQQSIDSIDIQETINNKQLNKYTDADFKNGLIGLGIDEQIATDWIKVRKAKKASNTKTAFESIKKEIELSGYPSNECAKLAVEKSWQGIKSEWIKKELMNNPAIQQPYVKPKFVY